MFKQWFLETWERVVELVWLLQETPLQEKISFMVSGYKTHKAKTLLLESERRTQYWPSPDQKTLLKKQCQGRSWNLVALESNWKNTLTICKTLNLQYKTTNFGCCKQEQVKERGLLLLKLLPTWLKSV